MQLVNYKMQNISKNLFPARLKELRAALSQKEMADFMQIPQQTYAAWELGTRQPKLEKLMSIALQFGVSVDWLLGMSEDRAPGIDPQPAESVQPKETRTAPELLMESKNVEEFMEKIRAKIAAEMAADHNAPPRNPMKVMQTTFELSDDGGLVEHLVLRGQDGRAHVIDIPRHLSKPQKALKKGSGLDGQVVRVRIKKASGKAPREKLVKVPVH